MKESAMFEKHKKLIYWFVVIAPIFFGCFSFSFVNVTYEGSGNLTIINIFIFLAAHYYIGLAEAMVFTSNEGIKVLLLNLILTCAGMGCRYLLEYGEVSNLYNFSVQNVLLHLATAAAVSTLVWLWNAKRV